MKVFCKVLFFFIMTSNLYSFDKEDLTGMYINSGYRNKPDALALAVGFSEFTSNYFSYNVGIQLMASENDRYFFWGGEFNARIHFGTRISPFIGVGGAFGQESIELVFTVYENYDVELTDVGYVEDDENYYYDKQGVQRDVSEKETDWLATIYPEIGLEYFIKNDISLTFTCRYHISNGYTNNFWLSYISISFWD